jgi:uncharacterized membrane protein YfcA
MLSALGLMGIKQIHHMNALKTLLAAVINGASVVVFIQDEVVEWHYAFIMAIAAILGGYVGARIARLLNPQLVRWVVILIGFGLAAHYFYQHYKGGAVAQPVT